MTQYTANDAIWTQIADGSAGEIDVIVTPINSSRVICQIAASAPTAGSDDGFEIVNDIPSAIKVGIGNYLYARTVSFTGKGLKVNVQDVTP